MVRPVHTALNGRARFKVEGLCGSRPLQEHLEAGLSRHEAIIGVSSSTTTGNVLVTYNSGNDFRSIATIIESLMGEYNGLRPAGNGIHAGERRCASDKPSTAVALKSAGVIDKAKSALFGAAQRRNQPEEPWHTLHAGAALEALECSPGCGLCGAEALARLDQYGPNALPQSAAKSGWSIFADQFKSLPVALLGVAAGISVLTGGLADAVVILGVVAINGVIGFKTESEAEKTINSLKDLVKPTADVMRDGSVKTVAADMVVPGDILVLRPGTYVSADARLIEANHLSIDESVLTGESMPAAKAIAPLSRLDIPLADRLNMVYMGTMVTGGQGFAVAVATGSFTEVGKLQALVGEAESPETPMEIQLNKLGDQLVLISGLACGLVFGIGLLRGYGFVMMLNTSISLAVAAVPEGLPTVATTTLAIGLRNMKKHSVLIRHLNAVETLGCIQTICFDKTGTITQNRMSVVRLFSGMKAVNVSNGRFLSGDSTIVPLDSPDITKLVETSVLCNETEIDGEPGQYVLHGSPTEIALVNLALQSSIDAHRLKNDHPLLKVNYRSESRLFMGTLHEFEQEGRPRLLIALKGSPVEVLAMCDSHLLDGEELVLSEDDRSMIEIENERMAADALRVLGVAYAFVDRVEEFGKSSGFVWLGLVGMADPVRPGVSAMIRDFHRAGIDTVMITGDQSLTAYAIGKELDLACGKQIEILDSTEITRMDSEALKAISDRVHVFARVSPAFKLEIVRALQSKGGVIAMTGDGINDGPALKAANIGIAMGQGGTDLAREVADVVLEEDNLETVIVAVRDGRTIYNNIRKALRFLLATNFSEIMVMFVTVAAGLPAPLGAMQLLWINLISDIFPGLALAMEAPEPDVLDRPPRPQDEPIVKASDFKRLTFEAGTLTAGAMAAYAYGISRYGLGPQAGTLTFQSLTMGQLLHSISCRSENHSIFTGEPLPPNRYLQMALGGSFALQMLTIFVPGLRNLLGLAPIGLLDGAVIAGTAALPLLINEGTKSLTAEKPPVKCEVVQAADLAVETL
ncbi:MAG: HAD-IC family P-type ATPase [Syntrophobacteraceae bacterium]|nr:HAD-IC family P-type ATPase [Syntrophobacteraceae bacterium]